VVVLSSVLLEPVERFVGDEFIVGFDGSLPSSDRKIVRYLVKASVPDVPAAFTSSLRTLGEVLSLLETHAPSGAPPILDVVEFVAPSVYMRPVMPQDHEQLYLQQWSQATRSGGDSEDSQFSFESSPSRSLCS